MRGDAVVAIKFHKLEVSGSIPLSATTFNKIWCSVTMNMSIIWTYINSKTYTYTMEEKQMKVLTAKNIRILITQVNELKIQKENIVSLQFNDGQYLLIYYGV